MGLKKPGTKLPTLTNPASAENIEAGFEAIDGNGDLITGNSTKSDIEYGSFTFSSTGEDKGGVVTTAIGKQNIMFVRIGSVTNTGLAWGRIVDGRIRAVKMSGGEASTITTAPTWDPDTGILGTPGATTNTFGIGTYNYIAW